MLFFFFKYLFNGEKDNVAGHNLDNVDFQQPPDEQLQFVEILQELEKEHREAVHHQVPFVLQICLKTRTQMTHSGRKSRRKSGENSDFLVSHPNNSKLLKVSSLTTVACKIEYFINFNLEMSLM